MSSVTFPVAVGGDGSTVTDDNSVTTGLANGGHRTRFVPALAQVVAVAQYVVTTAADVAADSALAVAAAADVAAAGSLAPLVSGTSTTSLAIGTGSKSFTTQSGKAWVVGSRLRASDTAANNVMDGEVTGYTGTSLTISVDRVEGSGTIASWVIGPIGPAGTASLTYFTEGQSTSGPNGADYANRMTATGAATNIDFAIVPKGYGAITTAIPDSTDAGGNKRGQYAVDLQGFRGTGGAAKVASGIFSAILGGADNTASGQYAAVIGGGRNAATGNGSVAGGDTSTASGLYSVAIGFSATASGAHSVALGYAANTRGVYGAKALGSGSDIRQNLMHVVYATTTDATPKAGNTDGGVSNSSSNIAVLPNNSSHHARIRVIAHTASGAASKSWTGTALIRRGANAASTTIVGAPTLTSDFGDSGLSTASAAVSADTTNGGLAVTFTGIVATTIYWAAQVEALECVA